MFSTYWHNLWCSQKSMGESYCEIKWSNISTKTTTTLFRYVLPPNTSVLFFVRSFVCYDCVRLFANMNKKTSRPINRVVMLDAQWRWIGESTSKQRWSRLTCHYRKWHFQLHGFAKMWHWPSRIVFWAAIARTKWPVQYGCNTKIWSIPLPACCRAQPKNDQYWLLKLNVNSATNRTIDRHSSLETPSIFARWTST